MPQRPPRLERAHHELHEQQRRLAGPRGLREVQLDARLLLAAKGRVGDDHLEAVLLPDLLQRRFQGVIAADVGILDAVQQQVHRPQQVGQRLLLDAEQASRFAALRWSSALFMLRLEYS